MLTRILLYIPVWTVMNRLVFNGLYFFSKTLFNFEEKLDRITSSAISGIHGITTLSLMINATYSNDILFSYHINNYENILSYSLSYFIYDIINDTKIGTATYSFIIHHLLALFSGVYLYRTNLGQLYVLSLFVELSSPFQNMKCILDTMDMKTNKIYLINGLMFFLMFFICRILYAPVCMWSAWTLSAQKSDITDTSMSYGPLMLVSGFTTLNVFWFYKMVQILKYKCKQLNPTN